MCFNIFFPLCVSIFSSKIRDYITVLLTVELMHVKCVRLCLSESECALEAFSQSVQSLGHVWLFATQWVVARQTSLSITNSRTSLKLTSIEWVMPSSHLILCRPLLLLPPIPPSIRVFSNESTLEVAKVLELQLQHQSLQWTPRTDLL